MQSANPQLIAVLLPLLAAVKEPQVRCEMRAGQRITAIEWPTHADTFVCSESDGAAKLMESM